MAQSTYERSDDLRNNASEQVKRAAATAEDAAFRAADHTRRAAKDVQDVASTFKGALDKSIKHQPRATLALAAAVGFVLGALWKA